MNIEDIEDIEYTIKFTDYVIKNKSLILASIAMLLRNAINCSG